MVSTSLLHARKQLITNMAETFTVFEKFGDVCAALGEEDRKELIYAINMYGMFGEEVELPYMLKALFIALKEDIDNSKSARTRGSKGGRPKLKPEVSVNKKPEVLENAKPEVLEVSENSESQTNTNQTNTNQTNTNKKEGRFTPPTLAQVREHCSDKGYTFDPEAFYAFYESKGWKVGRNPMKSWTAACVTWQKREGKAEVTHDDYSEYA